MWATLAVVLFVAIIASHVQGSSDISRQEIISYLIDEKRYDANIVPDFNKEIPTNVSIQITIHDIHSISETTMDYSVDMFLRQTWRDERLDYTKNSTIFDKLELDPKNIEKVWQPDTFFENEKTAVVHTVTTANRLMHIYRNGTVNYSMRVAMTLSCTMLLHKYPFDSQTCPLMMQSFGYTMDNIDLFWRENDPFIITNAEMPQFVLSKDVTVNKMTTDHRTGIFSSLKAQLHMQRKVGFYFLQVFVPSVLLVILSWVSFWVDGNAHAARVSLGVTCVLTMTTQSSGVRQSLPPVSYVKAIDVWMFVCLLFVFAALLEFAYVNILQRGARKHPKQVNVATEDTFDGVEENGTAPKEEPEKTLYNTMMQLCCKGDKNVIRKEKRHGDALNDGNARAKRVDVISRYVFPGSFTVFLILFASFCVLLPDPTVDLKVVGT